MNIPHNAAMARATTMAANMPGKLILSTGLTGTCGKKSSKNLKPHTRLHKVSSTT